MFFPELDALFLGGIVLFVFFCKACPIEKAGAVTKLN